MPKTEDSNFGIPSDFGNSEFGFFRRPPAVSISSGFICLAVNRDYTAPVIRNIIFDWSGTLVDARACGLESHQFCPRAGRPSGNVAGGIPGGVQPAVHKILRPPHAALAVAAARRLVSQPLPREYGIRSTELPHARAFSNFAARKNFARSY